MALQTSATDCQTIVSGVLDTLYRAVAAVSDAVWGPWTVFLLLGTGLFLTVRFRVVQVTRFRQAVAGLVPKAQAGAKGVLSPFQAFMTGLAGSVGTGNIAGVATAVVAGGPGAVVGEGMAGVGCVAELG